MLTMIKAAMFALDVNRKEAIWASSWKEQTAHRIPLRRRSPLLVQVLAIALVLNHHLSRCLPTVSLSAYVCPHPSLSGSESLNCQSSGSIDRKCLIAKTAQHPCASAAPHDCVLGPRITRRGAQHSSDLDGGQWLISSVRNRHEERSHSYDLSLLSFSGQLLLSLLSSRWLL